MEVEKSYYRDRDHDDLIVRVWYEDGKRKGEIWNDEKKEWFEEPKLAWMVADEIYENHRLTKEEVEKLTAE